MKLSVVYLTRPLSFYGIDHPVGTKLTVVRERKLALQVTDPLGNTGTVMRTDVSIQKPKVTKRKK